MTTATLDRAFEALSNRYRRSIVECLARGPLTTPELGRQFPISKQALSRHVHVLEEAGLVGRQPHGRVHELRLNTEPLDDLVEWTTRRKAAWEASLDRLDEVLKQQVQQSTEGRP